MLFFFQKKLHPKFVQFFLFFKNHHTPFLFELLGTPSSLIKREPTIPFHLYISYTSLTVLTLHYFIQSNDSFGHVNILLTMGGGWCWV